MMKTVFSLLLLFTFLFCYSQEVVNKEIFKRCEKNYGKNYCLLDEDKDLIPNYLDKCPSKFGISKYEGCLSINIYQDTDEDGIIDTDDLCPLDFGYDKYLGCSSFDSMCEILKKKDKMKYDELYGNSAEINYKSLEKIILDNILKEQLTEKNIAILFDKYGEYLICGSPRQCFTVNLINPIFNEDNLWNSENILYIQKKLNKNIIPLPLNNNYTKYNEFQDINFKKGITTINPTYRRKDKYFDATKDFYYIPISSKKLQLVRSSDDFVEDSDIINLKFKNTNDSEVIVTYLIYSTKRFKSFSQKFQYNNNEWKLIETK